VSKSSAVRVGSLERCSKAPWSKLSTFTDSTHSKERRKTETARFSPDEMETFFKVGYFSARVERSEIAGMEDPEKAIDVIVGPRKRWIKWKLISECHQ
jgi:hypothetical protein